MNNFYPGPSKVYETVPKLVKKAYDKGILSVNHRSPTFQKIYEKAVVLLKEKLKIPADYEIYFTSSATECWEIIAQSLIKESSIHLFNGAFGEKWFNYTHKLRSGAIASNFEIDAEPVAQPFKQDTICLTINETSNGTRVPLPCLSAIRAANPDSLLAIDATSSMGGQYIPFEKTDICYASVQKCFGLPAGLAIMVCSPKAIARAEEIGERLHYNSLLFVRENALKYQTHYTPNVLNIYLLMATLKKNTGIEKIDILIQQRYESWLAFFSGYNQLQMLSGNTSVQSRTVLAIKVEAAIVNNLKKKASSKEIVLGNGYGKWKEDTFRIANFPAIKEKEIKNLQKFLKSFFK